MVSFARRSLLTKLSVAVSVLVLSTLAWPQHPGVPVGHATAPVPVYTPPVYHAPVMPMPITRPPVTHPSIFMPPRNITVPSMGIIHTGIYLPPVRPIRPIRPVPPLIFIYSPRLFIGEPFWPTNLCWWGSCDLFYPWTLGCTGISSAGPTNYVLQASQTPVYVYGHEREDTPEVDLKDGTILNVTDYWVVDNQLHFTVVEEIGHKAVEHSIPFEELDLQKTVDANTAKGFRFLLRNELFEQFVRDHPDGTPAEVVPPHR